MKLCQKLAFAALGAAILGCVGTSPAAAVDFNLSGTFAESNPNPSYNNGYFSGTYSVDDSASYFPSEFSFGVISLLSQWDINLYSAGQTKLDEISSADPNWQVGEKFFNAQTQDIWGLVFVNPPLQKRFTIAFQGSAPTPQTQFGAVFLSGDYEQPYAIGNNPAVTLATIKTATSTPAAVPEPANVAGVCLLGLVGLSALMRKKVASSRGPSLKASTAPVQ